MGEQVPAHLVEYGIGRCIIAGKEAIGKPISRSLPGIVAEREKEHGIWHGVLFSPEVRDRAIEGTIIFLQLPFVKVHIFSQRGGKIVYLPAHHDGINRQKRVSGYY